MAKGPMPKSGLPISDCIDLEYSAQQRLALSTTVAQSAALAEGIYDVWYDTATDCYVGVGADNSALTTSTGYLLVSGNVITMKINDGRKIAGIVASGSGNLCYHRVL